MGNIFTDINVYWPQIQDKFPGFEKPQMVPAQAIRHEAAVHHADYMKDQIDQDPTAEYMFIKGNPKKGPCDRDTAVELFHTLMHDKIGMPSSYEAEYGMTSMEAADMEVLPRPADRRQNLGNDGIFGDFEEYFKQQMEELAKGDGEAQRKADDEKFKEKFGFDRNDPDIIDVDVIGQEDGHDVYGAAPDQQAAKDARALAAAQQYQVGNPRPILYCVCVYPGLEHNALGMDGARGRVGGGRRGPGIGFGRRPGGALREEDGPSKTFLDKLGKDVSEGDDNPATYFSKADVDEADDEMTPEEFFGEAEAADEIEEGYLPMSEFEDCDEIDEYEDDEEVNEAATTLNFDEIMKTACDLFVYRRKNANFRPTEEDIKNIYQPKDPRGSLKTYCKAMYLVEFTNGFVVPVFERGGDYYFCYEYFTSMTDNSFIHYMKDWRLDINNMQSIMSGIGMSEDEDEEILAESFSLSQIRAWNRLTRIDQ